MRVINDPSRHCAIEINRSPEAAALVMLDEDGIIKLKLHPMEWPEIIGDRGRVIHTYDRYWTPTVLPVSGEPYPVLDAVRKTLRGTLQPPLGFATGALDALVTALPEGDVHLFTQQSGFIGRFSALDDARLIARTLKERPVLIAAPGDVKELAISDLGIVLTALDPEKKWPVKLNRHHYEEIFNMAKAKKKAAVKKVDKVATQNKRADGPVAKVRALYDTMHAKDANTDSKSYIAAAEKIGINKGTASVQLGRWRKEKGYPVVRGTKPAKVKKDATPSAATAKAQGKGAKKKPEPAPAPAGKKVGKAKAAKQAKKTAAKKATKAAKSAQVSSPQPSAKQDQQDAGTASSAADSAATASTAAGATGQTAASESSGREPSPGPSPK